MGVNAGLLVDAANAFDGAHIACILGQLKEAGMGALHLATGFFFLLGRLQGLHLGFGEYPGVLGGPFFQAFEAKSFDREIMPQPDAADAAGADL
jgi:hypothetical protein